MRRDAAAARRGEGSAPVGERGGEGTALDSDRGGAREGVG